MITANFLVYVVLHLKCQQNQFITLKYNSTNYSQLFLMITRGSDIAETLQDTLNVDCCTTT